MLLLKLKETADPASKLRYKLCEKSVKLYFHFNASWLSVGVCVLLQQECEDTQVKLQSLSQVPELVERGLTRDERFHRGQSGLQVVSSSGRALLPRLLETLSLCHARC